MKNRFLPAGVGKHRKLHGRGGLGEWWDLDMQGMQEQAYRQVNRYRDGKVWGPGWEPQS